MTDAKVRLGVVAGAVTVLMGCIAWSGHRWQPADRAAPVRARKVVVVGFDHLRWSDIENGAVPNFRALAAGGAVGTVVVRTLSRKPATAEAYATIGAGSRVAVSPRAGVISAPDGPGGGVTRQVQLEVGVAGLRATNRRRYVATLPGTVGDALHRAQRKTAVVFTGNQPAGALAVADGRGRVDVAIAIDSATGVLADAVAAATADALAASDVVIIDVAASAPARPSSRRIAGLKQADDALGAVLARITPDTLVVATSVVPPGRIWHLEPIVVAGAGISHGYVESPSTKRLGLVTLSDVGPEILAAIGAPVPPNLPGHPFRYHGAEPSLTRLAGLDADGRARATTYFPLALAFIAIHVVVYGAAVAALATGTPRRLAAIVRVGALALAAFPLATFVVRLVPPAHLNGFVAAAVAGVDVVAVAAASKARRHPLSSLAWIMGATAGVLVADVATGAHLQVNSLLGYAPSTAGRYFGLGGSSFGVLAATTMLTVAFAVERISDRQLGLTLAVAGFAMVIFVAGLPTLGAKVGSILTLVPAFSVTLWWLAGRRLTAKAVVVVVAATVLAVAAAATFEALRAPEARSHLGTLVGGLGAGGGSLPTTVARKAVSDARVFGETVWSWAVLVIALFLLYTVTWDRHLASVLPPGRPLRAGGRGAIVTAMVGLAFNDTGIIIVALVLVYLAPYLALLALDLPSQSRART